MTDLNSIFPAIAPNNDGTILNISDTIIGEITQKLESRLNGKFNNTEKQLIKGLIHLAYNKSHQESRQPCIKDLVQAVERTEKTLSGDEQIRKFKELKQKLKAAEA